MSEAEPTPSASGAQAFVAHERGTQTGTLTPTRPPTRPKRLDGAAARAQRELAAVRKMAQLRERLADPDHPLGFIRCKQTAVCYLLRDCPDHGLRREEIVEGLGVSLRTVDYAHAKIRGDEGYVEHEHELAAERACRGQLPILRAIVQSVPRMAPANDVDGSSLHPGAQALCSSLCDTPNFSSSSGKTDLQADQILDAAGDLSAREFARAMLAAARNQDSVSRRETDPPSPRPIPARPATVKREAATRAGAPLAPVFVAPATMAALRGRMEAAARTPELGLQFAASDAFADVTGALRHPDCHAADPSIPDLAVRILAGLDDRELRAVRNPGGYVIGLVRKGLAGGELVDRVEKRRTREVERAAIVANPDLSERWDEWAELVGDDVAFGSEPPKPLPRPPRTPAEWAQHRLDEFAAEREALAARRHRQAEDAERERLAVELEARVAARERAASLDADGDPDADTS